MLGSLLYCVRGVTVMMNGCKILLFYLHCLDLELEFGIGGRGITFVF